MMLNTDGAPLVPAGWSVWRPLTSRIRLRLAGMVIYVIDPSSMLVKPVVASPRPQPHDSATVTKPAVFKKCSFLYKKA